MKGNLTNAAVEELWSKVSTEFQQFYLKLEPFDIFEAENAIKPDEDVLLAWDRIGSSTYLKFFAIQILGIGHSISNTEREHKVTSLIHTSRRNRLGDPLVDLLTKGNMALRCKQVGSRKRVKTPKDFGDLTKISDEDEVALELWAEQLRASQQSIANLVTSDAPEEALHGAVGLHSLAEAIDDEEDAAADAMLQFDDQETLTIEPRTIHEDEVEMHLSHRTTRSGREIRLPKKFLESMKSL